MVPVVAGEVGTAQGNKTIVYIAGSSNTFFALDAQKGNVIWSQTFETQLLPKEKGFWLCPNAVNATPTIDRSRNVVFSIADDGRLYGLDLGTGTVRFGPIQFVPAFSKNWSLNLLGDTVYASVSGTCNGSRPGLYAMDIRDLMAIARQRVTDYVSKESCKRYIHVEECPPFPTLPWW